MVPSKPVIIGTRGSKLALRQAEEVQVQLQALHPTISFDLRIITSTGDRNLTTPLSSLGLGVFVKELEEALLSREIDLAVHSLKDLPTQLAGELSIAAIMARRDARDALVSNSGTTLSSLPAGSRVGTGSPRRACLVRATRPDLEVIPIRGNVPTRLSKLDSSEYDALVLAAAGLDRLGLLERVSEFLDLEEFPPAPGQGALAVEVRSKDKETTSIAATLDHEPSRISVTAERAFLLALGGGCAVPIGAYGKLEEGTLGLTGFIGTEDGLRLYRGAVSGPASNAESLGEDLARLLLEDGAGELTQVLPQ
ncbi:MAG: hydroxymethylbilane synthase [Chloroflexi bacterium]|nr:MAG: hydroxymethylbilane synthase [Chloroflexota bacterium]